MIRMTADHPSVRSAFSNSAGAYYDIEQAKAADGFQVSTGVSAVGYSGQPGNENNPLSPHISISKLLYDHGRTDASVAGKEAAYSMQQAQINVTRENLNQQVLSLFTSAATNAKVVAVLDKEIAALQNLLNRVQSIARIDSGRASEINQVATRLNAVIASREMSNTSYQQALQQLSALLNREIVLSRDLPDLKKAGLLPASLDQARQVLKENPNWAVSREQKEMAKAAVDLASKWNRPKWSVQLSLDSPKRNGEMEPFKAVTLQVSSDINLWDGGSGRANTKAETQRLIAAEAEQDATLRSLKQQLDQLWVSLPLRERQINALQRQSETALQTWKAGEVQFFAGQRPLTDLISFATDYYTSLASYQEQQMQYLAAQWQIVAALGKMSDLAQKVNTLPANTIQAVQ
ncbi:TolC family protein [Erwinia sp. P6884]|uniref:TolC family protein n=1 Tax=Erwinia sp. P6884 TaxID=3141450 RepID=UPI00318F7CA3